MPQQLARLCGRTGLRPGASDGPGGALARIRCRFAPDPLRAQVPGFRPDAVPARHRPRFSGQSPPSVLRNLIMTTPADAGQALDEAEFDALEAILVSDAVPAESMSFASGGAMQEAITLVLRYHNEVVTTLLAEDGWEPFCYAPDEADGDAPAIGDEWASGFDQGLECWPEDWAEGLSDEQADAIRARLEAVMEPWEADDAGVADEETRLSWLRDAAQGARDLAAEWRDLGRPGAAPVEIGAAPARKGGPGRNDPRSE